MKFKSFWDIDFFCECVYVTFNKVSLKKIKKWLHFVNQREGNIRILSIIQNSEQIYLFLLCLKKKCIWLFLIYLFIYLMKNWKIEKIFIGFNSIFTKINLRKLKIFNIKDLYKIIFWGCLKSKWMNCDKIDMHRLKIFVQIIPPHT